MGRRILDPKIVDKIHKVTGKSEAAIGVQVSKLAAKKRVPSQVALVLLAHKHGVGTAVFQRKLDPAHQAAIRDALQAAPTVAKRTERSTTASPVEKRSTTKKEVVKLAIDLLIHDDQLRSKCADILVAKSNFDRPINQATLVLEERIRTKAKPPQPLVGEPLVNYAFHEQLSKTRLRVASGKADEQRGITQILRGFVSALRNITHHHIVDSFTQEDALRVCGFVDFLLRVVDNTELMSPTE
jgi:hypothetical protein